MRVSLTILVLLALLCLSACPQGQGGNSQPPAVQKATPPTSFSATEDSPAPTTKKKVGLYAISPGGETIKVHELTSGNTKYRGMYDEIDNWIWDNYDLGEEYLATQGRGIGPGETLRAVYVTQDGYVIPNLEALRFELKEQAAGQPTGEKPGPFALYAIGVLPKETYAKNQRDRDLLKSEFMPNIPSWLGGKPPYWALRLPNGEYVTKGRLGQGRGFYLDMENLHFLDDVEVCHYSPKGRLIKIQDSGKLWCELFFEGFEDALVRHGIGRDSVREFGHYLQFLNLGSQEKTGYYYYDGTPMSLEQIRLRPDFNNLFEMYGRHLPEMFVHQQDKFH